MNILRVPVTAGNMVEWVRKAATAINQLIQASEAPLPGPFADDSAANTGGVPVGGTYRKPDGTLGWRVS
ncbi:hypothetical protein [Sphingomonas beigongshangi]|uniref:hypothetical protein n=1 Tax=Sphingomonas beigongshangi TaxID=2782540 RepID=UPI00193B0D61|nr:hypothetical protein [Sphingomonas beigongshangi]